VGSKRVVTVLISTGGPADWFEATVDNGEIERIEYVYQDWCGGRDAFLTPTRTSLRRPSGSCPTTPRSWTSRNAVNAIAVPSLSSPHPKGETRRDGRKD
jgi:hypothetical protein